MFNITFIKPGSSSNRFDNLRATPYLESFIRYKKLESYKKQIKEQILKLDIGDLRGSNLLIFFESNLSDNQQDSKSPRWRFSVYRNPVYQNHPPSRGTGCPR